MVNIYQNCVDLINTYVYGGTAVVGTCEHAVACLVSTCACLLLVALPFLVVWRIITMLTSRW